MFKYILKLTALLLSTTAIKVYHVIPEGEAGVNKTGLILNHYLEHSDNFISSNTQFCFSPGQFNLHSNLTIRNVSNFLLTGSGDKQNVSVIQCSTSTAILFYNSTNITVTGFRLKGCAVHVNHKISITSSLSLLNCSNIMISHLEIDCLANNYGILVSRVFGISTIQNITSN